MIKIKLNRSEDSFKLIKTPIVEECRNNGLSFRFIEEVLEVASKLFDIFYENGLDTNPADYIVKYIAEEKEFILKYRFIAPKIDTSEVFDKKPDYIYDDEEVYAFYNYRGYEIEYKYIKDTNIIRLLRKL